MLKKLSIVFMFLIMTSLNAEVVKDIQIEEKKEYQMKLLKFTVI